MHFVIRQQLVITKDGFADVTSLPAGDNSPFTIQVHRSKDKIDRYNHFQHGHLDVCHFLF
jgi:hypothetical protein